MSEELGDPMEELGDDGFRAIQLPTEDRLFPRGLPTAVADLLELKPSDLEVSE